MNMHLRSGVAGCAFGVLALATTAAQAAEPSPWQSFASVTPVYQGGADIDGGGDYSMTGLIVRGGTSYNYGNGTRAGVTLNYDYMDYSFSNSSAFGAAKPWNVVQRYGIAVPLALGVSDGWSVGFTPSADWYRENGADTGDSLIWGASLTGVKQFADGNRLGLGVGVYSRLEETSVFPFLLVDWRLSDRWRLVNPLPSGPTGPAGLELDYQIDGNWTAGVGAAYRTLRFRLSDSGPVRNGIGEESGIPVFLRVTRSMGKAMALHFYGGVVAGGKLRVENSSGNLIREENFDPAPMFGLTFVGRF